ncbi:hypothetical protein KRR55_05070 [Paeniglutamicibacter sp. ABSL32-1]|uniref:hypothetical protein n=1 Tax=Paeniglutamicibacter quisquiliarum TaxID=2849498 RepID=UPI001C2CDB68|nr:hypothetical protein [Paeniglutamicibacter quisquiliarum]MBV1778488.1 hypothetical protein [Paeniglutamicibacter quisquiliarum]
MGSGCIIERKDLFNAGQKDPLAGELFAVHLLIQGADADATIGGGLLSRPQSAIRPGVPDGGQRPVPQSGGIQRTVESGVGRLSAAWQEVPVTTALQQFAVPLRRQPGGSSPR